jgi:hypothetical protein
VGEGPKVVVGFWRRFVADLVDALILAAFGWIIGYPFRYVLSDLGSRAAWIGFAISLLYAGCCSLGSVAAGRPSGRTGLLAARRRAVLRLLLDDSSSPSQARPA